MSHARARGKIPRSAAVTRLSPRMSTTARKRHAAFQPMSANEVWEFGGWGSSRIIDPGSGYAQTPLLIDYRKERESHDEHALGQWRATAICGNDITSSCFYVTGLVASSGGGKLSFVSLALVAVVLYLYRRVYAEVVTALPLNGGCYNVMLNATVKSVASLAACLTVVSADSAVSYAKTLFPELNNYAGVIGLLAIFATLVVVGLTESATVALGIFIIHVTTLSILTIAAVVHLAGDTSVLHANWTSDDPAFTAPDVTRAIFYGFSAGLLGLSGFESSANFVEEQKPGVFPKTLRNMWCIVSFFNPVLCFLSIAVVPLADVADPSKSAAVLSLLGKRAAGRWLEVLVAIDAMMVLSGAVLTAYVGSMGLIRRLTLDRLLPAFLGQTNKWRGTLHWIAIVFFAVCSSMFVVLKGDTKSLGGVYTISFLSVMALFACGNLLLKYKRGQLHRSHKAWWGSVLLALFATLAGLVGNMIMPEQGKENIKYFAIYYSSAQVLMLLMLYRVRLLRMVYNMLSKNLRKRTSRALRKGGERPPLRARDESEKLVDGDGEASKSAPLLSPNDAAFTSPGRGPPSDSSGGALDDDAISERGIGLDLANSVQDVDENGLGRQPADSGCLSFLRVVTRALGNQIRSFSSQPIVFFTSSCNISKILKSLAYVRDNEASRWVMVVHCCPTEDDIPDDFVEQVSVLDQAFPKLRVDSVVVLADFSPDLVVYLSNELSVPQNYMFISAFSRRFQFRVHEFGGVRMITH